MSKININGIDLEINMFDADTAEKVENAIVHVKTKSEEIRTNTSIKFSQSIRCICNEVFDCFNTIFGAGTDKQIFGDRTDMGECLEAFAELSQQTLQAGQHQLDSITQKYAPNREIRHKPTEKR